MSLASPKAFLWGKASLDPERWRPESVKPEGAPAPGVTLTGRSLKLRRASCESRGHSLNVDQVFVVCVGACCLYRRGPRCVGA
jgi:hypothetical protein